MKAGSTNSVSVPRRRLPRVVRWLLWGCVLWAAILIMPGLARFVLTRETVARVRGDAVKALSAAHTQDELRAATGELSTCLHMPDGSWIAIRYRDTHHYPNWSLAVALCSDGTWYQSERHFCGSLQSYESERKLIKSGEMDATTAAASIQNLLERELGGKFWLVEESGNLAAGKQCIESLGFSPFSADAK